MPTPEQQARQHIDQLLLAAGWQLQEHAEFNRNAAPGVAVREFPLASGPCDYLLFVQGRACGVIEAKKVGVTLSAVAEQSARYLLGFPQHLTTTLPRIEPHRLRALIREDLRRYPGSSSSEIQKRTAPELGLRTIRRALEELRDRGEARYEGEKRWRRYWPASNGQRS